ncbi:hypothetical protein [Mongoliibacter ruber]|nr:hypothetical protein [Mongoliibacter ruber]
MKKILPLIFLIISVDSFCQDQLSGKFCNSFNDGYSVVCIEFLENNSFKYELIGCLGVENFGKGEYQLTSNQIKLIFDEDSSKIQSSIKVENLKFRDRRDSIEIVFHIVEKANQKEPLPAMIFQESDSFEFEKVKQANSNGNLILLKPKNRETEKYNVLFLGYERFEFTLENHQSKNVTIELAPEAPEIISNRVFTIDLSKITPDLLVTIDGVEYKKNVEP